MARWVIENSGARVEGGPYPKLARAQREAVKYYRNNVDDGQPYWHTKNGIPYLMTDDGYNVWATGITVVRED